MNLPEFVLIDLHDDQTAFAVLHTREPYFVFDPEEHEVEWWSAPPPLDADDLMQSPLLVEAREFYEKALRKAGEVAAARVPRPDGDR